MFEVVTHDVDSKSFIFACPNCAALVQVLETETNCCIFRHGVLKVNGQQINPHTPKQECDRLFADNEIEGCGKPFKFIGGEPNYVEKCDYI